MVDMRKLIVLLVAGVLGVSGVVPAAAQAPETVGIRIVDVPTARSDDPRARQYIVDHLAPGATITRRVEVSNDTPRPQVIQLYAGAASIVDGNILFGEGRAANDLTSWTKVDPPEVRPAAGAKALATVTIAVPRDASPGERYGVVWAELPSQAPPGGGVTAVNRVGVRMYLSVGPGGEPASDFAITAFEGRRDPDGRPLLAATVSNTGGRAIDLSGELRLTNGPGGLSAGPFPAKLGTTLGLDQSQPVLVPLDPAIPLGPWDARIVLRSGTTEREGTARITFPEAAATATPPVQTKPTSDGRGILPLALGAAAVVALAAGAAGLGRRWSRRKRLDRPA